MLWTACLEDDLSVYTQHPKYLHYFYNNMAKEKVMDVTIKPETMAIISSHVMDTIRLLHLP